MKKRLFMFMLCILLSVVCLAGCGGSGEGGSDAGNSDADSADTGSDETGSNDTDNADTDDTNTDNTNTDNTNTDNTDTDNTDTDNANTDNTDTDDTGTNGSGDQGNEVTGELEDLIRQIYDDLGDSVTLPRGLTNLPLSEDMGSEGGAGIDYYIGAKGIPFAEGVASESLIGSMPYSLVLLRMTDDADIEDAKKQIRDHINPAKWICVSVDPSNVVVDNIGNLVILILSEDSQAIHDSFLKLSE